AAWWRAAHLPGWHRRPTCSARARLRGHRDSRAAPQPAKIAWRVRPARWLLRPALRWLPRRARRRRLPPAGGRGYRAPSDRSETPRVLARTLRSRARAGPDRPTPSLAALLFRCGVPDLRAGSDA